MGLDMMLVLCEVMTELAFASLAAEKSSAYLPLPKKVQKVGVFGEGAGCGVRRAPSGEGRGAEHECPSSLGFLANIALPPVMPTPCALISLFLGTLTKRRKNSCYLLLCPDS